MGNAVQASPEKRAARKRLEARIGIVALTGRVHVDRDFSLDYERTDKVVGSGFNGKVTLAKSTTSGQDYAIKELRTQGVPRQFLADLKQECEVFLMMDHPHIARLVNVYETTDTLVLVMEYLTGGHLYDRLKQQNKYTEHEAARTAYQMLLAVNYMHSQNFVHRDLKLENFLYESPESNNIKLIDFGMSKEWLGHRKMALVCGSLNYTAPEVLSRSYTNACDLWSLGVIVFMLLGGYPPFQGSTKEELTENIRNNKYIMIDSHWGSVSNLAKDFVQNMLVTDTSKRLSAQQALEHPWIAACMGAEDEKRDDTVLTGDVVLSLGQYVAASRLRRACMQMVVWSLSSDDLRDVQDIFLRLDKNKKGTISLSDLKQELASQLANLEGASPLAMTPLAGLDSNHDESIHFSDFLAAMVQGRISLNNGIIRDTFNRFDTEHTGVITTESLCQVLGEQFEGEDVTEMIREAGGLEAGRVTYEEFREYIKGPSTQAPSRWLKKLSRKVTEKDLGNKRSDGCWNAALQWCCPVSSWPKADFQAYWCFREAKPSEITLPRPAFNLPRSIDTDFDP